MPYGSLLADVVQSSTSGPATFNNTSGTEVGRLCRAWVQFNGTSSSPTVTGSFNVGSITYISTGNFQVNFTTAMADTVYATVFGTNWYGNTQPATTGIASLATTSVTVGTYSGVTATNGASIINVAVFR